jgi:hypothetical protein
VGGTLRSDAPIDYDKEALQLSRQVNWCMVNRRGRGSYCHGVHGVAINSAYAAMKEAEAKAKYNSRRAMTKEEFRERVLTDKKRGAVDAMHN